MQISTSVGVVQDILISLSFQNAKLIADPSRSQDQSSGICVNCPAAELACRPSLRSSRASEANVPERAIAHRRKRADRRLLDAPNEGGHHQYFRWPSGDLSMFARIFRASQGTRWKSYSYSASISSLRGAGHPAALSAAARRPAFRLPGVNSFAPAALFLGIGLFAPHSARAATWQS